MSMFDDDAIREEHEFFLLNKDDIALKFKVITVGSLADVEIIENYQELPEWMHNATSFIYDRRAPKNRENMWSLLKASGCDNLLGYLNITHALSLIDTFWVKPVDSTLSWKNVSLYTHEFNEDVAKAAFDGASSGENLFTTSPEYSTDGSFAKCWIREQGQIKLLKRGSSGARNAGLEPYSEFYISQISKALGLNAVQYDLRTRASRVCSVCDIFTSETYGYLPFSALGSKNSYVLDVVDFMESLGFKQEICDMFVFDAVVFNEDRHKGNFGFIVNNETQKIESMAPLFDHNIALLCYAEKDDFDNIDDYLSRKGPRIGEDFVSDARGLLTPSMRKKLIALKGFEFERHPKLNLPEWRLKALEKLINRQIKLILE